MPNFEVLSQNEAQMQSATGKRAQVMREYLGYIERLGTREAGRLTASEGETTAAIGRRLGAAAKLAGQNLVMRRSGDGVLFWHQGGRRRERRARQAAASGSSS